MNLVSLSRFLGVKESTEIIFRVKKVGIMVNSYHD